MGEGSLTYFMLIIARILFFRNEGHRHPNKVWSQSQAECIRGIRIGNLSILKLTCYLSHYASRVCFKCSQQLIDKLSEKIYCHLFSRSLKVQVSIPYHIQNLTVPHPDVFWYRLNGIGTHKNAPKKVLVTLFPYIFLVKPKTKFKRLEYPSPNALKIKQFWTLHYNYLEVLGITKLSNLQLQENGIPRKRLDAALPEVWSSEDQPAGLVCDKKVHCMKNVQIRSFFWSLFSCIQSEYRKIRMKNNSVF